jgi:hypothetical protein
VTGLTVTGLDGAAKDRGDFGDSPQTQSLRIAVEAGVRVTEALGEWADWAKSAPLSESGQAAESARGGA